MTQPLYDYAGLDAERTGRLTELLPRWTTLDRIVTWLAKSTPRRAIHEIVTHDEFTHDVVVSFDDLWLVFGVT